MLFGLAVTVTMVMEYTWEMTQDSFRNEDSIVYQMTNYYFSYS